MPSGRQLVPKPRLGKSDEEVDARARSARLSGIATATGPTQPAATEVGAATLREASGLRHRGGQAEETLPPRPPPRWRAEE